MESPEDAPRVTWAAKTRDRLQARWARMPRWGRIVLAAVAALLVLLVLYRIPWTGFGAASFPKSDKLEYRPARTLWDWLGLLVVPAFLAVAGYLFAHWKDTHDRKLETDRLQEDVLQGYLDRMAELILREKLGQSEEGNPARHVARSRTLLALRRLDGRRKAHLLRFLYESRLIIAPGAIVRLSEADLRGALLPPGVDLRGAALHAVDLSEAVLNGAILNGVDLFQAKLRKAKLRGAFLCTALMDDDPPSMRVADLTGVDFSASDLSRASFNGADLTGANFTDTDLRGAVFHGAKLNGVTLTGAKLTGINARDADFTGTDLSGLSLKGVILHRANFFNTSLRGTDLTGANIAGASFYGARDLTQDQIDSAQCDEGTRLPEGLSLPTSRGNAAAP